MVRLHYKFKHIEYLEAKYEYLVFLGGLGFAEKCCFKAKADTTVFLK